MFYKEKLTQEEIKKLKEIATEFYKLKKCLAISNISCYDYGTQKYELIQNLDITNPVVKELSVIATKVNMILNHLGLRYTDEPSLLKNKCVEMD